MCAACELINRPRITYAPFYVIDINHNQTGRNIVTHYYYRSLNTECVAPIPFDFIRFNYNNQWVDTTVSRERREKKLRSSLREMRYSRRSLHSVYAVFRIHFNLYNFLCGQFTPFGFYTKRHWLRFPPYSRYSMAATRRSAFECVHIMTCHAISILIWQFHFLSKHVVCTPSPKSPNHFNTRIGCAREIMESMWRSD